jgi:hypothetical protein
MRSILQFLSGSCSKTEVFEQLSYVFSSLFPALGSSQKIVGQE